MKLSDFPVSRDSRLAWTPDNRSIAVGGDWRMAGRDGVAIYLIPVVQRGEPRAMTRPTRLSFDYSPAFSPDGRRFAYASCVRAGPANSLASGCHVHVVDVDTAFTATSPVHRLTSYPMTQLGTVSWTRDGTSVIFSTLIPADVFRVGADGDRPPERIELVGPNASNPATVSSRDRLAFAHRVFSFHLYRFEPGHSPRRMLASSQAEFDPQFSRDGHHIAFASARSGKLEIWVADANGTGVHQFTEGPGEPGSPHWSPDDRSIAFDVKAPDGHYHIWTLDADGGTPRQLTRGAGNQTVPTWSQDGRWVYFSADLGEGGPRNIWRLPAAGGAPEQVTHDGSGALARELADGKSVVYQPNTNDSALLRIPLDGGTPRELVGCVKSAAFDTTASGIFYVACDRGTEPSLHVKDQVTGRDRLLGTLEKFPSQSFPVNLAVAPDGTTILYVGLGEPGGDLMLIENFR
jgi:Tol biopolymer transport system component